MTVIHMPSEAEMNKAADEIIASNDTNKIMEGWYFSKLAADHDKSEVFECLMHKYDMALRQRFPARPHGLMETCFEIE